MSLIEIGKAVTASTSILSSEITEIILVFNSAHVMAIIPKHNGKVKVSVILNITVHRVSISVHEIRTGNWT